jgi:hypothetical protein
MSGRSSEQATRPGKPANAGEVLKDIITLGATRRARAQHALSPQESPITQPSLSMQHEIVLTPEERAVRTDLQALLNAYDLSSPEEQTRMREEVRSGEGEVTIPGEQFQRGLAAAKISDLTDVSREKGLHDLETLEELSVSVSMAVV